MSAASLADEPSTSDAGPVNDNAPVSAAEAGNGGSSTDAAVGNPICGVAANTCWPDDDGQRALASGTMACAPAVPDGGVTQKTATADASTTVSGCRVTATPDDPLSPPRCDSSSADTRGVDGVSCQTGDDCAPGFDCVDGDNGAVCRRYCCSGTCDGYPAANNGPTFCDVRSVNRDNVSGGERPVAPVCMPIKSCTLLQDGDCGPSETCAIVNDKGVTGCVPQSPSAQAGDSCEQTHCAAGQTCLGSPGNRTCYQLCRTNGGDDCGSNEICTTSAAFQDTSYGICKTQH